METSRWSVKSAAAPDPAPPPRNGSESKPLGAPVAGASAAYNHEPYTADPSVDEFAQTRPPDDLFDDDFTPIAEAVVEAQQPVPETVHEPIPTQQISPRDVTRDALRGPRSRGPPRKAPVPPAQASPTVEGDVEAKEDVPAQPKPERKEGAVRGDRSATGGPKKTKLTDEELTAKLQAMKLKNASLMEKHVKSQADEESFNAREAVAAQRRKEDRVNRVQMMGEREKNRQRKLKAVGGREWDMEKNQEDFAGDDGRRARRGAHGGITGDGPTSSGGDWQIKGAAGRGGSEDSPRGRGRGRGRGEGRGRGRGGPGNGNSERPQKEKAIQAPPSASEFPDLPAAAAKPATDDKGPTKLDFPIKPKSISYAKTSEAKPLRSLDSLVSPTGEKKSWADQVEGATG